MPDPTLQLMRRALQLAKRGQGYVEPNPMVGALLVRDGNILAEGYHHAVGQDHAEVDCLRNAASAGIDPAGATMVVTLEPCCHHGKTPPCAEALIAAKVARVIVAMTDPNPQVAGQGFALLRDAGIAVDVGICEAEAQLLNAPFIKRITTGRPWVIAKWAQTLDGRIATASGDSKWISNARSRRFVHRLRARVDTIMVGVGTAVADNPALTAREVRVRRVANRVVIDPTLRIPRDAALLTDNGPAVTIAVNPELANQSIDGASLTALPLAAVLDHLGAEGATNVLVEGGANLVSTMVDAGLVDQVLAFIAPKLLGDDGARAAVTGWQTPHIHGARPLTLHHVQRLDDDVLLDYRIPSAKK